MLLLLPQQLSGLWYHNRTNHPEVFASHTRQLKTLIQCDVCFKFFPNAATLAKHQAAEHQGEDRPGSKPHLVQVLTQPRTFKKQNLQLNAMFRRRMNQTNEGLLNPAAPDVLSPSTTSRHIKQQPGF